MKNQLVTLCKFQGCAWWCAVGGFTLDFPCCGQEVARNNKID
jgi:hypothetical protein